MGIRMGGHDSNGDTIGIGVWRRVEWPVRAGMGRVAFEWESGDQRFGRDAIEYGCDCSGYRYVRFAGERGGAAGRCRAAGCRA